MSSAPQIRQPAASCLHVSSWLPDLGHRAKPATAMQRSGMAARALRRNGMAPRALQQSEMAARALRRNGMAPRALQQAEWHPAPCSVPGSTTSHQTPKKEVDINANT